MGSDDERASDSAIDNKDITPNADVEAVVVSNSSDVIDDYVINKSSVYAWVLYDLANTVFSMGVISLLFPLYVQDVYGSEKADPIYGIISAISMLFIFVLSPLLGAMTDRAARRMPFLIVSTVICICFTALLGAVDFYASTVLFIVANISYQAGLQFYDALLPEVSTPKNRGMIGGIGVGIGYFGAYVAVAITVIFSNYSKDMLFALIALAFLVFGAPSFFLIKERGNPNPRPINWQMVKESSAETWKLLKEGEKYPGLLRFLLGRVFYTDSINTVISIMALYTVNIAQSLGEGKCELTASLPTPIETQPKSVKCAIACLVTETCMGVSKAEADEQAKYILVCAITFAVVGGFFWGYITDKVGPKKCLNIVLIAWMIVFTGAGLTGILGLPMWFFYVVASSAGFCLGGIWAADRPFMLRLTPPDRIGEFYGLYGMVGRFSAITGPIIWAIVTFFTIQISGLEPQVGQGYAVATLLVMIFISYYIMYPISDQAYDPAKQVTVSKTPAEE